MGASPRVRVKRLARLRLAIGWSLAAAVLGGAGCGPAARSDLGQVHGTVTMDGKPLADAQIVFSPSAGRPSTGVTDAEGKYELTYLRDVKGAVVGTHSVRVETIPKSTSDQDGGAIETDPIPEQYNAASTLTREVKPGENNLDFPLQSR